MPSPAIHTRELEREQRRDRTAELLRRVGEEPEHRDALLDEVVLVNRGVADAIASRYRGRGVADDDLRQAAYEGLVKAVQRFDPTVRPDLLTYAVPTIRGEVQRWLRDQSWTVRPPRRIQELQWRVSRSVADLGQQLGREPTDSEVGADIDAEAREVGEARMASALRHPPSLDRPVDGAEGSATLGDVIRDPDESFAEAAEARLTLAPVVRNLSERDRRIVYLRFFEEQSQTEIGRELGVTQMQVSRLIDKILTRLRRDLAVS